MKNQNNKVTAVLFVIALALAPMVQAAKSRPGQLARHYPPADTGADSSEANGSGITNLPMVSVYATDNVIRGKTGTFVLRMKSKRMLGGTYVMFSLSGTAVEGADYKLVAKPVYISQSGYGTIQIDTLPDFRGSSFNQAYSVIVTLTDGAGYRLNDASSSAIMWIK